MAFSIKSSIELRGHKTTRALWKIRVAVARPRLAWAYTRRRARLRQLTNARAELISSYYEELHTSQLETRIVDQLSPYRDLALGFCGRAPELYVLVRVLRPRIVVETGVGNGVSSTYILAALERNNEGKLFSVDLPGIAGILAPTKETGWLVPNSFRHRWELGLGRSLDILPGLLRVSGPPDFFLHDSDHSYEYMKAELRIAWQSLSEEGVLLADDVWDNAAFNEFAKEVNRRPIMIANVGAIHK